MIDAVDTINAHSIVPLLVYAGRVYGTVKAVKHATLSSTSKVGDAGAGIFAAIQGKSVQDATLNPLKVLLQNSPYFQYQKEDETHPNILAGLYLQFPNASLKRLAMSIVSPSDSNDTKVAKITAWVIENIKYMEDEANYGTEELWAAPTMTLAKKSGDCEDGAFLIHSLALNAGVPAARLRTYGGLVKAGAGAATGGHGWTAYLREPDNQWVVLDFSYYPSKISTGARSLMKDDKKYIDDFFYMTLTEYVLTEASNRVRNPDNYDCMAQVKQNAWIGTLIDRLI